MSDWNEKHFDAIWYKLIEIYGTRFTREYGATPNKAWRTEIAKMSFEQAKYALDLGLMEGDVHPPTLAQFCNRARQYNIGRKETQIFYKSLPKPEVPKEETQKRINKLKEMLRQ